MPLATTIVDTPALVPNGAEKEIVDGLMVTGRIDTLDVAPCRRMVSPEIKSEPLTTNSVPGAPIDGLIVSMCATVDEAADSVEPVELLFESVNSRALLVPRLFLTDTVVVDRPVVSDGIVKAMLLGLATLG